MQFNRDRSRSDEQPTWELPWLARVEVDLDERPLGDALVGHLLEEVVAHQLLVARVEPEPGGQRRLDLPQRHRRPAGPNCSRCWKNPSQLHGMMDRDRPTFFNTTVVVVVVVV